MSNIAVFGVWPRSAIKAIQRAEKFQGFAFVSGDGTLQVTSGIFISAAKTATGVYDVLIDPAQIDLLVTDYGVQVACVSSTASIAVASPSGSSPQKFIVHTFTDAGVAADRGFTLTLYRNRAVAF